MDGTAGGPLFMLRIEIDGHFHGSQNVPKPWVARIDGVSSKYGLERTFIQSMNDWREAHQAGSGNTYGVIATFPLRPGNLYEISRCRGNSSKRRVVREFRWLEGRKMQPLEPLEALAIASGEKDATATVLTLNADEEHPPLVKRCVGLGRHQPTGFVIVSGDRQYRLAHGHIYMVQEHDKKDRLLLATDGGLQRMTEKEALLWLASRL